MIQKKKDTSYGLIILVLIALLIIPSSGIMGSGVKAEVDDIDNINSIQGELFINENTKYTGVDVQLNKTYGTNLTDLLLSVIETSDGNYLIAGEIFGYLGSAPKTEIWLSKINENGVQIWNQTYGGTEEEHFGSIIETSDGGYAFVGYTFSYGTLTDNDVYLVKINSSGAVQWSQHYDSGTADWGRTVIQTSDGGYLLCGKTWLTDYSDGDIWFIKTNSNGVEQWNKTYGGTEYESLGGILELPGNKYLFSGSTTSYGSGNADVWLFSTDNSGNMEENKTFGSNESDYCNALIATSDGGFLLAGSTTANSQGSSDVWMIKLNSTFSEQWNGTYGGLNAEAAQAVIETSKGTFLSAGYSYTNSSGEGDLFLVEASSEGNFLWKYTTGGSYADAVYRHAINPLIELAENNYLIVGYTESFGGATFTNSRGWVLKLKIAFNNCPDDPSLPFDLDPYTVFLALLALLGLNVLQILIFLLRRK